MENTLDPSIGRSRTALFLAAALVGFLPLAIAAETGTGTLAGVVRDTGGGALVGATIRVIGEAGSPVAEVATDARGSYKVTPLAPGKYRVEAALSGFEAASRQVALDDGSSAALDLSLS